MSALTVTRPPMAASVEWLKSGFRLFYASAIPWMGMSAAFFLASFGISLIPVVGPVLVELVSPLVVAAFMASSRAAERGEPAGILHLGAGLQGPRNALLILGAVYMLASQLVGLIMRLVGGEAVQQLVSAVVQPNGVPADELRELLDQATPAILLGTLLFTPVLVATWFAPALVLFDGFSAGKAMFWSLWACLVNWRPMLAYGLLVSLLGAALLLIPFGLGLLVFLPVAMASTYAAYNGQFVSVQEA
jgi:uncharacterized membrane protein